MFGRHTGFAIYFFPGVMAVLLFLLATRDRAMWQWLTLIAGVGSAVVLLLYMPFTYSGGGGPVGNRYFLGSYGVFLFLVPPLQTAVAGLSAMAISSLFVAPIVANPFYATRHPQDHSKTGLFRWLPTELTMVNDLPINVAPSRDRVSRSAARRRCSRISSTTTSSIARAMRSGCAANRAPTSCCARRSQPETAAAGVADARVAAHQQADRDPRDRAEGRIAS